MFLQILNAEGSSYHQGHKTDLRNVHKSNEGLMKDVFLGGEMLYNTALQIESLNIDSFYYLTD